MKKILIILLISLFLISGCGQQEQITGNAVREVVCNEPYIQVGTECCLDKDSNSICDKDEITPEEEPTPETEPEPEPVQEEPEEVSISKLMNNVVEIKTELKNGSGFFVDSTGYLITNHHIIQGYEEASIKIYGHPSTYTAKVLGYDYAHDIAVLKVDSKKDWEYFPFADSIKMGDTVYALGSPFSKELNKGVIIGKNKAGLNDETIKKYLQTDASINSKNSGGPLVNEKGEVVGLNTLESLALDSKMIKELYQNIRYIGDIFSNPEIDQIAQENFDEKIKIAISKFTIAWNKERGDGTFLSFDYKAQNEDAIECDVCFNVTIIRGGVIILSKGLDEELKLTSKYHSSSEPIVINSGFEGGGNYYFEITSFDCENKGIYSKSLLKKEYYQKGGHSLIMEEGDSEFVFGRVITVENIKYRDSKSYSVKVRSDDVTRRLNQGNDDDRIDGISISVDEINKDYVVLIVSY